ncbi:MAG: hypothetical protein DRN96_09835 [Thermoproteota archaeon]|nr:MAG: hypothetical protein DRN96_09835 [Candidatus Korarchaeota archaeon]
MPKKTPLPPTALTLTLTLACMTAAVAQPILLGVHAPSPSTPAPYSITAVYYQINWPKISLTIKLAAPPKLGPLGNIIVYLDTNPAKGYYSLNHPLYSTDHYIDINNRTLYSRIETTEEDTYIAYWQPTQTPKITADPANTTVTIEFSLPPLNITRELRIAVATYIPGEKGWTLADRAPTEPDQQPPYTSAYKIEDQQAPQPKATWHTPQTPAYNTTNITVYCTLADDISGVDEAAIAYSTDGKNWSYIKMAKINASTYIAQLPTPPWNTPLLYYILCWDKTGNYTVITNKSLPYKIQTKDNTPPRIQAQAKHIKLGEKHYTTIVYANITEHPLESGVRNATLHYKTGEKWTTKQMHHQANTTWYTTINTTTTAWYIEAQDNAGNKATTPIHLLKPPEKTPTEKAISILKSPAPAALGLALIALALAANPEIPKQLAKAQQKAADHTKSFFKAWLAQLKQHTELILVDTSIILLITGTILSSTPLLNLSIALLTAGLAIHTWAQTKGKDTSIQAARKLLTQPQHQPHLTTAALLLAATALLLYTANHPTTATLLLAAALTALTAPLIARAWKPAAKAAIQIAYIQKPNTVRKLALALAAAGTLIQLALIANWLTTGTPVTQHIIAFLLSCLYIIIGIEVILHAK